MSAQMSDLGLSWLPHMGLTLLLCLHLSISWA